MKIPKIIHQIWSGIDGPLPLQFRILGKTWERDYPDWEYIVWDNEMMTDFIKEHYPQYWKTYNSFPYNIQRWDAIRYLILDKMGGMYVDYDYESREPMDDLLADKTCCFAVEPSSHRKVYGLSDDVFNNAMMLSTPGHFFMRRIIESVFERKLSNIPEDKFHHVLNTTGPGVIIDLYYQLTPKERELIYLIPAEYVTPLDVNQVRKFRHRELNDEATSLMERAYAMHYFCGNWAQDA